MKRLIPSVFLALCASVSALSAAESGIDKTCMDCSVRVQDDLYHAVNGTWLARTEIPADRSNYGCFTALDDTSNERIKAIIEEAAKTKASAGSDLQKVGDLYRSFMDAERIEQRGLTPLAGELAAIDALRTPSEVMTFFGRAQVLGVPTPLAFFVGQDDKISSQYIAQLYQSGTSLPDRDYYLQDEPKFVEARNAFKAYATRLFVLSGTPADKAEVLAANILALETGLARAQRSKVELRDPERNYNKLTFKALGDLSPGLPWSSFLSSLGVKEIPDLIVGQPEFVEAVGACLSAVPVETWQAYLRFHLLDAYAGALPRSFEEASFAFHGKALAGIPQEKPRWKKAVALIAGEGAGDFGALGDVVGRLYVERHFPSTAKQRMDVLVGNLFAAYRQSIGELSWMTPATKERAAEKLSKYMTKIGYPQVWRDYSALTIREDDLIGNLIASSRLESARNIGKLGKPIDRQEWGMTPQTVNAYYNPGLNEIVFPAAILQPPFFNANADDAVNYGGIGAVIGHEISHGFDDQGSQYDGDGNLRNWWTPEDSKAFKELTTKLVAQYSGYEALPGKFVNGELTLGENIADLSGLAIAYKAYRLSLQGKPSPVIDGLTGEQRVFLGWSQVWRRKYREPELIKRLKTDPHSPSQFRANGPVMNSDAFMEVFGVKEGDKLFKPSTERIRIW